MPETKPVDVIETANNETDDLICEILSKKLAEAIDEIAVKTGEEFHTAKTFVVFKRNNEVFFLDNEDMPCTEQEIEIWESQAGREYKILARKKERKGK